MYKLFIYVDDQIQYHSNQMTRFNKRLVRMSVEQKKKGMLALVSNQQKLHQYGCKQHEAAWKQELQTSGRAQKAKMLDFWRKMCP